MSISAILISAGVATWYFGTENGIGSAKTGIIAAALLACLAVSLHPRDKPSTAAQDTAYE